MYLFMWYPTQWDTEIKLSLKGNHIHEHDYIKTLTNSSDFIMILMTGVISKAIEYLNDFVSIQKNIKQSYVEIINME